MDGAAGYPPWSAPHESRSPPTAKLRSGRFARAQARWVATGVPWNEGSAEALMVLGYYPRPEDSFHEETIGSGARLSAGADGSIPRGPVVCFGASSWHKTAVSDVSLPSMQGPLRSKIATRGGVQDMSRGHGMSNVKWSMVRH